ncbi:MAG: type II toxin-antitoxin system RelE/ParE family toxin [bacterium]|nr:type II toxin-antitoxin system RelE/ParE family toxin [bacterium]MDP3771317.1 type II toxin-antitoxin system RelE/ParE family toxin [bacterium]
MAFDLTLSSDAERDLNRLDRQDAQRILRKMRWFAAQPNPLQYAVRLSKPAIGDFRFRIGDLRALTVVDMRRHRILVLAIGYRGEVYRR